MLSSDEQVHPVLSGVRLVDEAANMFAGQLHFLFSHGRLVPLTKVTLIMECLPAVVVVIVLYECLQFVFSITQRIHL